MSGTSFDEVTGLKQNPLANKNYEFMSLKPLWLDGFTRKEMKDYFENTYDLDELLFSAIKDERYFYACPNRLRLPLIFYVAHTATLYINKLLLAGMITKRVNRDFETLFETGVNEMSWDDPENYRMGGSYQWPSLVEVLEYRRQVREVVIDVIENAPLEFPIIEESPWWSLLMGIEHERIHIETSSVLIRQLPVEFLEQPPAWHYAPVITGDEVGENSFITVPAGRVRLGKPVNFPTYGWDCEYGGTDMEVPEFQASKYLITNKEFLAFVNDNGYCNENLWSSEGWLWVQFSEARHPVFWVCDRGCPSMCAGTLQEYSHCKLPPNASTVKQYRYHAMYDVIDMPWDWPVDVNYHEAKAFCKWKGPEYRLPTEAEHNRIRGDPVVSCDQSCDPLFKENSQANISFKYGSATPVNMFPPTALGFYDVYGNVWNWVEDHMNGFPGFKVHYLYNDYTCPSTDGNHTVSLGGSWATSGTASSRFSRTWFRRHFFQHMGFRLVKSMYPAPVRLCRNEIFFLEEPQKIPLLLNNVDLNQCFYPSCNEQFQYESMPELEKSLMPYNQADCADDQLVTFYQSVVDRYDIRKGRALHLGCGAGYVSFMLTKIFENIVGLDYCGLMIAAARKLQSGNAVEYSENQVAQIPLGEGVDHRQVQLQFVQLTWLPNEIINYDFILVEFLDRVQSPKSWLVKLWECIRSGGIMVISGSSLWNKASISTEIGNWFELKESTFIGNNLITVWKKCV